MPELHASARKHFGRDKLTDEDVLYSLEQALTSRPLDDEDDPRRWLVIGVDSAGRTLELVIHAMKARRCYRDTT